MNGFIRNNNFSINFWAGILGNILEHYDTAVFSLIAPFIAPLFFPTFDPITAMMLTYGMLPLGSIARPVGTLVFGYIGNRYGRKRAFSSSLMGLALVTGLMGCLPTFSQVGYAAPALMAVGRILQNFFVGGEVAGGAIFILEHSPQSKHCMVSSLYGSSTIVGITMASGIITFISWTGRVEDLWRVPFLIGFITALGSIFVRTKADESPAFNSSEVRQEPVLSLMKTYWLPLLAIAAVSGYSSANYSLALILPNGFLPKVADITQSEVMGINSLLLVGDMLTLPFFGWLSNKLTPKKSMMLAAAFAAILAAPLYGAFENATWIQIVVVRSVLVALGVWFSAPLHAWVQTLIPAHSRYLLISIGYAIGSKVIAAPAVILSLWIYQETGIVAAPGIYWAFAAGVAALGIYLQPATTKRYSTANDLGKQPKPCKIERVSATL